MPTTDLTLAGDFPPATAQQWRELVDKALSGRDFDDVLVSHTRDGIRIDPLYTAHDHPTHQDPSGFPGFSPRTRGQRYTGSAGTGWEIRQRVVEPRPVEANQVILTDLERGVNGISLRFDDAFCRGLDPDDHRATGSVGRNGVAAYSAADLDLVLDQVLLDLVGLHLEPGAAFVGAAQLVRQLWEQRGLDPAVLTGGLGADPLAVLAGAGRLPTSIDESLGAMADLARESARSSPGVRAVRVSSGPYASAGASEGQEIACVLATGVAYLRALTVAGLDVGTAAGQIEISLTVSADQFGSIAKVRAARRTWARVLEAAGATDPSLSIHVVSSPTMMTRFDPWVNMLRATIAGFAGGAGGADAVTVLPFDWALGIPTEMGRRIARNTQLILQEESSLSRVIDPAGGSWFVEYLTEQLAHTAWATFQDIEDRGGMVAALTTGDLARQIEETHLRTLAGLATRAERITGISEFPDLHERRPEIRELDEAAVQTDAVERVARARKGGTATIGGLTPTDEPVSVVALEPAPPAEMFEVLREAADAYRARTGSLPRVFSANLGPLAVHNARAVFVANFLAAGGIEVVDTGGYDDPASLAAAFSGSGTAVAVLCSSDAVYGEWGEQAAKALVEAGARRVYLAGRTSLDGVDDHIAVGSDVVRICTELHQILGVSQR